MTETEIQKSKDAQAAIAAKISELKSFEGKTFKRKDGTNPNQTIKIVRYEGVGKLGDGTQSHLFRVESKNPGAIYTPPATQFLKDHEEVEVSESILTKEII